MRTKRGGFKATKPKQGKARVRIKATGAAIPPKHFNDRVHLAEVVRVEFQLERPDAGLKRYLRFRAPRYLWA